MLNSLKVSAYVGIGYNYNVFGYNDCNISILKCMFGACISGGVFVLIFSMNGHKKILTSF